MACGPRHTKHLSHCLQHLPTFQATFASYAAFYIYVITSAWPAKPPPKAPRPTSSLGRSCAPSSRHASSASAFRGHTSDPESRSSSIDGHVFLECEIIDPCTTRVRPCGKACSPTCMLPLLQRHGSQVTRRTHHLLLGSRPPRIGHPIGRADRRGGHPCAAASHQACGRPTADSACRHAPRCAPRETCTPRILPGLHLLITTLLATALVLRTRRPTAIRAKPRPSHPSATPAPWSGAEIKPSQATVCCCS